MSTPTRLLRRSSFGRLVAVLALVAPLAAIGGAIADAGPAAASTSAETSAVNWALRQVGQTEHNGVPWVELCLPFVQDAYEDGAGPHIPIQSIAQPVGGWNSNTDPQDVWAGTFSAGTTGTGANPPYGSLVFFDAKPGYSAEDFSHVEIMGSNGEMTGTPGGPGQAVFEETLAQHEAAGDYNTYVGWWLPDGTSSPVGRGGDAISGKVTDTSGHPLSGICVAAFTLAGFLRTTTTATNGTYTVAGLPPGSYGVEFSIGCGNPGNFAVQYYNDVSVWGVPTSVTVTSTTSASAINAALLPGATISGKVINSAGRPLPGICITATPVGGVFPDSAITTSNGTYKELELDPGKYTIEFSDPVGCGNAERYVTQCYRNVSTLSSASVVSVRVGGSTSGIDATLHPATKPT